MKLLADPALIQTTPEFMIQSKFKIPGDHTRDFLVIQK